MKKNITVSLCYDHLIQYSQYAHNLNWAKWYSKVAPLKGQRVVKTLLDYKEKSAKILDLGCGTGLTLAVLSQTFRNSVGCDIGAMEVRATRELLNKLGRKNQVILYDGLQLPFRDKSFDIVTSIEVIEHVDKPEVMLKEIKRVLKSDGILHITTANKWWPIEPHFKLPFLSYLPPKLSDIYVRLSGRGDSYENIRLPGYRDFRRLVEKYFRVDDITLEVIKNFQKYAMHKERGGLIIILAKVLSLIDSRWLESFVIRFSLGWLFIARPK